MGSALAQGGEGGQTLTCANDGTLTGGGGGDSSGSGGGAVAADDCDDATFQFGGGSQ